MAKIFANVLGCLQGKFPTATDRELVMRSREILATSREIERVSYRFSATLTWVKASTGCRVHHDQLHQFGKEIDWWAAMDRDVDPLAIARTLWEESQAKITATDESETVRSFERPSNGD